MTTRIEGWLQCENCGHNAMPLDPEFRCTCSRCAPLRHLPLPDSLSNPFSSRSMSAIEILHQAVGSKAAHLC